MAYNINTTIINGELLVPSASTITIETSSQTFQFKGIDGLGFNKMVINDNVVIAAFESVSNFDVFTIDGEWTIYDINKSSPAIVREDDTLGKSSKLPVSLVEGVDEIVDSKMGDFGNTTTFNDDAIVSTYENGTKVTSFDINNQYPEFTTRNSVSISDTNITINY